MTPLTCSGGPTHVRDSGERGKLEMEAGDGTERGEGGSGGGLSWATWGPSGPGSSLSVPASFRLGQLLA